MLRNPIAGIKIFYDKLKHKIKEVETFSISFLFYCNNAMVISTNLVKIFICVVRVAGGL